MVKSSERVEARLSEEFRLIETHGLAGFLLLYREIVLIAQRIMEERGLVRPETPVEERPPGRGRGSSVALLVRIPHRYQPRRSACVGPHAGEIHLRRHDDAPGIST